MCTGMTASARAEAPDTPQEIPRRYYPHAIFLTKKQSGPRYGWIRLFLFVWQKGTRLIVCRYGVDGEENESPPGRRKLLLRSMNWLLFSPAGSRLRCLDCDLGQNRLLVHTVDQFSTDPRLWRICYRSHSTQWVSCMISHFAPLDNRMPAKEVKMAMCRKTSGHCHKRDLC